MSRLEHGTGRQRGFSLVEMMIAIALGLLVTGALISMFVGVRSASRMTSGVGALTDSGRFALDTIQQVVRNAGDFTCDSTAPVTVAGYPVLRELSLLNAGGSPLVADYGEPLSGYEAVGTGPGAAIMLSATPAGGAAAVDWTTTPTLGGALDAVLVHPPVPTGFAAPVGSPIAGSDVLVVHETLPGKTPAYTTTSATGAGAFTIDSSTLFSAAGGQIGVISNCVQMEVFQAATFTPGAGTGVVALTGGAIMPGNNAGTFPSDPEFSIGSQVAPVDSIVFYIGVGADGDGALFKYETNGGVLGDAFSVNQELVPDVENMQVLYGVETVGSATTQTADQYVTADNVQNVGNCNGDVVNGVIEAFNCVISVKIALLVASPPSALPPGGIAAASTVTCSTLPPTAGQPPCLEAVSWQLAAPDSRVRKVFEQTMFLRDMSP